MVPLPPGPTEAAPDPASTGDTVATLLDEQLVLEAPSRAGTAPARPATPAPAAPAPPAEGPVPPADSPWITSRYADLGHLASGAMGEVRRVYDAHLDCVLAMKLTRPELAQRPHLLRRFEQEVRITAQLRHPSIVAVSDRGALADGRLWFTMQEVGGRTLEQVFAELHGPDGPGPEGPALQRVLDAFVQVCRAVAYAHSRGVVHRDLKPSNIMVGRFGEVMVMDWGVARGAQDGAGGPRPGEPADPGDVVGTHLTMNGQVVGTLSYMAPEQAQGAAVGPWSDVYGLGSVLYELLTGVTPLRARGHKEGPPVPVERARAPGRPPVPPGLARLVGLALTPDPADRPTAEALADEVTAWLDGSRRREQALADVGQAAARVQDARGRWEDAGRWRAAAARRLEAVGPLAPPDHKRPAWQLEAQAAAAEQQARDLEFDAERRLVNALALSPGLPEARRALAALVAARHARAESAGDAVHADYLLRRLAEHDDGAHAAYLRGEGRLTLHTAPAGALVEAAPLIEVDRRRVPGPATVLGRTPLREIPLSRGAWQLTVRRPGFAPMRLLVQIERGAHEAFVPPPAEATDGGCPEGGVPYVFPLIRGGALGPDERQIPAGWYRAGGDPLALEGLPPRRLWVDGLLMQRSPVRMGHWERFVRDVARREGPAAAEALVPRSRVLPPLRLDGPPLTGLEADRPALNLGPAAVDAFLVWERARTGLPWRLPHELEWEKAARGVDARAFPWGDQFEPAYAWTALSSGGRGPLPVSVPLHDLSPYGVEGMAGQARDLCANGFALTGPPPEVLRAPKGLSPWEDAGLRMVRGGSYAAMPQLCRAAARFVRPAGEAASSAGLRLVRDWPLG